MVLNSAPHDLIQIEKLIDRKEQKGKAALTVEQADPIYTEIQALEWVRMILRGADVERANLSKLA